jgi:tryptophan synthase beta chain
VKQPNTKYSLGSVLNHVMLHQTVIGQEVMQQLEQIDVVPDYMVACVGGGSNFAGFTFPMIGQKIKGKIDTEFIAVEPCSVPSMTKGENRYDYGDTAGMTRDQDVHLGTISSPRPSTPAASVTMAWPPPSRPWPPGLPESDLLRTDPDFDCSGDLRQDRGHRAAPESSHAYGRR